MASGTHQDNRDALIITADQQLAQALRSELEAGGRRVVASNSVAPARKLLRRGHIDLLLMDLEVALKSPAQVDELLGFSPGAVAFLLLADQEGQQGRAIQGLEPDAILDLPLNPEQLRSTLRYVDRKRRPDSRILGRSEAVQQIREMIAQIASTPVSVLITGESGTGKDLVAESIHHLSPRRSAPFLTVNCGAIPETLLESELFGHEKGAFTDARIQRHGIFEAADGGTVFLDEIGEMSLPAQVRLLRVLENHEITRLGSTRSIPVDVRVIAATNRELQQAVAQRRFRHDLYYRLKVVEIPVPPLREHPEDIPILTKHFIQRYGEEHKLPPINLDAQAVALLQGYHWPGNVRELKNLIERLMVMSVERRIGASDLTAYLEDLHPPRPRFAETTSNLPVHLDKTPEESHRDLLYWAILEVARDIKELKAYLMHSRPEVQPLPVYPPEDAPLADQGLEVEYQETDTPSQSPGEIKPLRDVEKDAIAHALRVTGGHRKRAAQLLDMPERTLYRKIRQYDL